MKSNRRTASVPFLKMKRSDINVTIKATLAKKNSEMEKLEKSKKAHLRMISSSGAKIKLKHTALEEMTQNAKNIKMYETHVPGFCYLRNGECRKRNTSTISSFCPNPIQCSEKVKALLFTDNELDIFKTMCLHLLGTHVQSKDHIQRKDGRLCSYIKAQTFGNAPHTLQHYSHRIFENPNNTTSKYDTMLPRYILDVKLVNRDASNTSIKLHEIDSGSDEEVVKKRKLQVPVYINNEIRMIIHSVLEALEAVGSSKFKKLIDLASSPEELRNMLKNEDWYDYITELSTKPFITKPTSYDFVMAHLLFDKIPEKGTLESIAQVLEIYNNVNLQISLRQIRKSIFQRHTELVNSNIIPRGKTGIHGKYFDPSKMLNSNYYVAHSLKYQNIFNKRSHKKDKSKQLSTTTKTVLHNLTKSVSNSEDNKGSMNDKQKSSKSTKNLSVSSEKNLENNYGHSKSISEIDETSLYDENKGSFQSRSNSIESNKCNFQNLSNPQRILLGLKVASLKCKPMNMHQFDGKKKIDLSAILAPIIHPEIEADSKYLIPTQHSTFSVAEKKEKSLQNNISEIHTSDLENLTRTLLANLRLDISETENKTRVNRFMSTI